MSAYDEGQDRTEQLRAERDAARADAERLAAAIAEYIEAEAIFWGPDPTDGDTERLRSAEVDLRAAKAAHDALTGDKK